MWEVIVLFTDCAFPVNYSMSEAQIFAENRRKLQIFAETDLSHLVCRFQFRPNFHVEITDPENFLRLFLTLQVILILQGYF